MPNFYENVAQTLAAKQQVFERSKEDHQQRAMDFLSKVRDLSGGGDSVALRQPAGPSFDGALADVSFHTDLSSFFEGTLFFAIALEFPDRRGNIGAQAILPVRLTVLGGESVFRFGGNGTGENFAAEIDDYTGPASKACALLGLAVEKWKWQNSQVQSIIVL